MEQDVLAKSRLSTTEMRRLRRAGIGLGMIAKLAGITPNGVRNRLRAKPQKKAYLFDSTREKQIYITAQRQRQEDYQRQSLRYASEFGAWTPEEIRYLEKKASEMTLLEIALHLQRTYFSVAHFANRHGIKTRK